MAEAVAAFPRRFYCEHTPSKARVHALVCCEDGSETLTAVLTVADGGLAGRVARALNEALVAPPGRMLRAEIDEVREQLPLAPRASFMQAVEQLGAGTWSAPAPAPASNSVWSELAEPDEGLEPFGRPGDEFTRSPYDARLAGYSGPVVRMGRLLELHVHDVPRALHAARSLGWTPDEDEDLDADDHLVDAVMWLADEPIEIPGVDVVTGQRTGKKLIPGKEEIADWSRKAVTFRFDTGWRLRDKPFVFGAGGSSPVDFTELFPMPTCDHPVEREQRCEQCEDFLISPRTAAVLATAFTALADECQMDIEEHGDNPVEHDGTWACFDELPRITWWQDAQWRARFAQAADELLADLISGHEPRPRCRGEEMVLHLALRGAKRVVDMMNDSERYRSTVIGTLPEHRQDYDWDACVDSLLEDSDILFLYDRAADGIEDPESEINKQFGIGDLRPANWFEPLRGTRLRGTEPREASDE
jgi:hypothetical protein